MGGMGGVGAMRYEAVTGWLDENGVSDPVSRARFRSLLQAMDEAYLEDAAKKITPLKGKTP